MEELSSLGLVCMATMLAFGQTESAAQSDPRSGNGSAPPMLGIYWAKAFFPRFRPPPPEAPLEPGRVLPLQACIPFSGTALGRPDFCGDNSPVLTPSISDSGGSEVMPMRPMNIPARTGR